MKTKEDIKKELESIINWKALNAGYKSIWGKDAETEFVIDNTKNKLWQFIEENFVSRRDAAIMYIDNLKYIRDWTDTRLATLRAEGFIDGESKYVDILTKEIEKVKKKYKLNKQYE